MRMVKIVWMSDPHFTQAGDVLGHNPRIRLAKAIEHINRHHEDTDLCVISGDLVNRGTTEDYRALRAALDGLSMPYAPMMGNHDDRALLRAALPLPAPVSGGGMSDFIQYSLPTPAGLLVCLDTHRIGSDGGEFCADRFAWLEAMLHKAGDTPVFLFMHHPPMALGLPTQDKENMADGDVFLDRIARFSAVKHLFIGHVHRAISGQVRGIPFATMRSVLLQAPAPRPHWDWSSFTPAQEPPNIGILTLSKEGSVLLHYEQFCGASEGVSV